MWREVDVEGAHSVGECRVPREGDDASAVALPVTHGELSIEQTMSNGGETRARRREGSEGAVGEEGADGVEDF